MQSTVIHKFKIGVTAIQYLNRVSWDDAEDGCRIMQREDGHVWVEIVCRDSQGEYRVWATLADGEFKNFVDTRLVV